MGNIQDFDTIPIDTQWNDAPENELKIYRIHAYPAKFPAFVATKAIQYAKDNKMPINTMADIFCGCGTTAFEAKRNNVNYWGCDIDPVVTLIARRKSRDYQLGGLKYYYETIMKNYKKRAISGQYKNVNKRLKYWYTNKQYNELAYLKSLNIRFLFELQCNKMLAAPKRNLIWGQYFQEEILKLNETGKHIVQRLMNKDKSKAQSVAKYLLDMQDVVKNTYNILNTDGMIVFVIGNTKYKGVKIDIVKHLANSLRETESQTILISKRKISKEILTPYRDKNGKFTTDANGRKIYREKNNG
ncbi:MAG: class I SAM-dependent methyltransferase [Bacteroidales bacterium]|nr:class I SAM-dependent methyltransferase [Bacteroidales bacterium]